MSFLSDKELVADLNKYLRSSPQALAGLIFYDKTSARWRIYFTCATAYTEAGSPTEKAQDCGGWLLDLRERERERRKEAEAEGRSLLECLAGGACIHCQTLRLRADTATPHCLGDACIWYDTMARDWILYQSDTSLSEGGYLVHLGVPLLQDHELALVAARALASSRVPLPLAVSSEPLPWPKRPQTHTLYWDERWRLWAPCQSCGGATFPLSSLDRKDALQAGERAMKLLVWLEEHGCVSCNAAEKREENILSLDEGSALYWFDPLSEDWVLTFTFASMPDGITVPLEIGYIDASSMTVELAAQEFLTANEAEEEL